VHFAPKHVNWLNAAVTRPASISRQCIGKCRIPDLPTLRCEVAACSDRGRAMHEGTTIRWKFRVADARRVFRYDQLTITRSKH